MAEIVLRRPNDLQNFSVSRTAGSGNFDFLFAGEVLPRQAVGVGHDLRRSARRHHLSAMDARAGADVNEVIRCPHGVLVMLHHDEAIAQIPQIL